MRGYRGEHAPEHAPATITIVGVSVRRRPNRHDSVPRRDSARLPEGMPGDCREALGYQRPSASASAISEAMPSTSSPRMSASMALTIAR